MVSEDDVVVEVYDEGEDWKEYLAKKCGNELSRLRLNYRFDPTFIIDYYDVVKWSDTLAERIHTNPEEVTRRLRGVIPEVFRMKTGKELEGISLEIRFVGLKEREVGVRDIRSSHIRKLISVRGIVRSVSEIRPEMVVGAFRCLGCGMVANIEQDGTKLRYPVGCTRCDSRKFEPILPLAQFKDSQRVSIQEEPEGLEGGEQPKQIVCRMYNGLSGQVSPGTRCAINGILKPDQKGKDVVFDIYLDVMGIEFSSNELRGVVISEDDETAIRELAHNGDIISRLVASFANGIYGYDEIKLAILMQLVGGVTKPKPDGSRLRGDIHVLLLGDPGVAKSEMMRVASKVSPRGVISSGKSSTSAGLTCTAVKDELGDGRWVLEAGALVLADGGFIGVDELDKMSKEDRSALHEAMEQQTVSVNKAGISTVLHTRCALLGAANPKLGRFSPFEPVLEQVDMPPSLLSRFDLIFPMIDTPGKERDSLISTHIMNQHRGITVEKEVPIVDQDFLRKYITYSRENISPILPEPLGKRLSEYYVKVREMSAGGVVTITARQLQALVRMSEASAKLRLSPLVEEEDVDRSIALMEKYLRSVAYDENTKSFDTDLIATKISSKQRSKIRIVLDVIRELTLEDGSANIQKVFSCCVGKGMGSEDVDKTLEKLKNERLVFEPRSGYVREV